MSERSISLQIPFVVIILLGGAISIAGSLAVVRQEQVRIELEFDQAVDNYSKFLQDALRQAETAITWVARVPFAEKEAFEKKAQEEVIAGYHIKERDSEGNIVPATKRDEYFPILYTETAEAGENISAWGIDPMTDANRRKAFKTAWETGQNSATGAIRLLSTTFGDEMAVAVIQPVYRSSAEIDTTDKRRPALQGFVVGIFEIPTLLETSLQGVSPGGVDVYLYDASVRTEHELLHFRAASGASGIRQAQSEEQVRSGLFNVREMDMANRAWIAIFKPAPGNFTFSSILPMLVLVAGLLLTGLLALYQRSIATLNVRISYQVARQTEELKNSERRFRTVLETTSAGTIVIDQEGVILIVNPAAEKVFGYELGELIGRNVSMLMPAPDSDRHDTYIKHYIATGENNIIGIGREVIGLRKNGEKFQMRLEIGEMQMNQQTRFVSSITDLTEFQSLEEQLRQSQKLEAVGQLTGGLAHDFNNLLAVIEGNLSMLEDDLNSGREVSREDVKIAIESALLAGRRGADLTHRLLAFSRKQALKPEALDINQIVKGMESLLIRTLGEDINLSFHFGAKNWRAAADVSQLESALLNLALNSRDAMQDGGSLTIETDEVVLDDEYCRANIEVAAGDYVLLAVTDSGIGMTAETLGKVFEPFFTTKEIGRGTGLGLSMVYGFAKQSDGHIAIYSEPGSGTTIRLYLPRVSVPEPRNQQKEGGCCSKDNLEKILILEDDEDVRNIVVRQLKRFGYKVLQAGDGQSALQILEQDNSIDLLLSDVILAGGMNGPEVARQAEEFMPDLKVLFISGYTKNAIMHQGRLGPGVNLLSKPFSNSDLQNKIRELLDVTS